MAVGKVSTSISLSALPDGLTFTVTGVKASNQSGSWYSYISAPATPFTVSPGERIASVVLSTSSVSDTGQGLTAEVDFTLQDDNGLPARGSLVFSTTDWPLIGRPDNALLTANLSVQNQSGPASTVSQQMPVLLDPPPFSVGFALQGDLLTMAVAREDSLGTEIMSDILQGIITAHTSALSWITRIILFGDETKRHAPLSTDDVKDLTFDKTFRNDTAFDVDFTAYVRDQNSLTQITDMLEFTVQPRSSQIVSIPNNGGMPFLNGVVATAGDSRSVQEIVHVSGDEADQLLNTNNTLAITESGSELAMSGAN